MGFENNVIETINQMNSLMIKSDAYPADPNYLLEAAVIGCRTLKQLSGDPDYASTLSEFADVRLIAKLLRDISDEQKRRERHLVPEFLSILEDPTNFEAFLELEREIMIKGGLSADVIDSMMLSIRESARLVIEKARPTSEIIETTRILRDRACILAEDLIDKASRGHSRDRLIQRLKRILLGLGGGALIGLNASTMAPSVGLTAAGSVVSVAVGAAILQSATADAAKTRSANE